MSTITTIERQNFNYIKNIPGTLYLGGQPILSDTLSLVIHEKFKAASIMRPNAVYNELHAIGIFDPDKKECIIAFKNIDSLRACIKFVYGSSLVIPHRWYFAKRPDR